MFACCAGERELHEFRLFLACFVFDTRGNSSRAPPPQIAQHRRVSSGLEAGLSKLQLVGLVSRELCPGGQFAGNCLTKGEVRAVSWRRGDGFG